MCDFDILFLTFDTYFLKDQSPHVLPPIAHAILPSIANVLLCIANTDNTTAIVGNIVCAINGNTFMYEKRQTK